MEFLTFDNIVFFIVASLIFTAVIFLLKQVSKLLAFIVFCAVMYYFWIASSEQQSNIKNCFSQTYENKKIADECRDIF